MRLKIFNKNAKKLASFIKTKVHLIVFSPPYWNLRNYSVKNQIGYKQTYKEFCDDMFCVFKECYDVLENGRFMAINIGTVVSNDGMKFISGDFVKLCERAKFIFRKDIIWHKPKGTTKWQRGATQFTQNPYPLFYNTNINHEFILIFQKGEKKNVKNNAKPFNRMFTRKMAYSVWDIIPINSPQIDERHVAPYPEDIPRRLVQLYSYKNETVLDPFAGSGTTNKVALELGRKTIAVEISSEYCKLIRKKTKNLKFNSYDQNIIYDSDKEIELLDLDKKIQKTEKKLKNLINKKKKLNNFSKKKIKKKQFKLFQ